MIHYYDMVKAYTATTGTGSVTVGSAVSPYRPFSGVVDDGALIRYLILDGASAWERGYGVYNSGTGVLTRILECSSTGALLNLSGSATVENVMGADDIVKVLVNVVPQMTTSPSGGATASASSSFASTPAWMGFQNKKARPTSQPGWINNGGASGWLRIQFDSAKTIYGYGVNPYAYDVWSGRNPKTWTFERSSNGTDWTIIDTVTNFTNFVRFQEYYFPLSAPVTDTHFRINVTANNGDGYLGISELALYGVGDLVVNGHSLMALRNTSGVLIPINSNSIGYS